MGGMVDHSVVVVSQWWTPCKESSITPAIGWKKTRTGLYILRNKPLHPRTARTMLESMSRRVRGFLTARGGHTSCNWCGDMAVSLFNKFVKTIPYAFRFLVMTPLCACALSLLWSYLHTLLCNFTSCRVNSRLGPTSLSVIEARHIKHIY